MSEPITSAANRISPASGICRENGDQNKSSPSSPSPTTRVAKKDLPGSRTGVTQKSAPSSVIRLTHYFDTLATCNVEVGQQRKQQAYQLNSKLQLTKVKVIKQMFEKCESKDEKIKDSVQVNGIDQHIRAHRMNSNFKQAANKVDNDNDSCDNDCGLQNTMNSSAGKFGKKSFQSSPPIEAQNSFVVHNASHNEDAEISDVDSFESINDEEDFLYVQPFTMLKINSPQQPPQIQQLDCLANLENQLPAQNQILTSKQIDYLIKEMLETEERYIQTLEKGIECFSNVMQHEQLPKELKGLWFHIFGSTRKILQFHKHYFLPQIRQNQTTVKGIAETFINLIENDAFYCYILFALDQPVAVKICEQHKDLFEMILKQHGGTLILNSFLLEPIQRLPRYKLFIENITTEALKLISGNMMDSAKIEVGTLCRAEKRVKKNNIMLNDALCIVHINKCYELNLNLQGKFRKMFEVNIYDGDRRRRYPGKVFFFEKCIIYTEEILDVEDHLEHRGHYLDYEVGLLQTNDPFKLYLFANNRGHREVKFSASDKKVMQNMIVYAERVMHGFASSEVHKNNDQNSVKDSKV